ncbi:MAG: MFS transporter [Pseudomonadota bacterium]
MPPAASTQHAHETQATADAAPPLERNPVFWFYGSASAAYGIKNNAFSYLLLIYANQVLGLPGYLASAALAIAMLWDALSDLLLGHWSDKTSSRLGRRHPFMYAALLFLPLCFYLLFTFNTYLDPAQRPSDNTLFLYLLILCVLIRTGTTLFEVPSTALLPDLEADYHRRSRWLALRHAFGWYGGNGIHTLNFWFWVGAFGVAVQQGYTIYATWGAAAIFLSILVSSLGTQRVAASLPRPTDTFRLKHIAREIAQIFESVRNRNFGALFVYGLCIGVASGLGMALYLYNTTYFFGFTGRQIAITGLFVFISPLIAYFVIPRVGPRFGKKRVAICAILINITLYPMPYVALLMGWWPELGSWLGLCLYSAFIVAEVVCSIVGNVMLDSMMADVVEDSEVATTRRSEGLFYAARGFAAKAISAGGIVFAGTIVTLVGLDGVTSVDEVTWELRFNLATFFLPLYCGLYLLGLYMVSKYRIEEHDHAANLDRLGRDADSGAAIAKA